MRALISLKYVYYCGWVITSEMIILEETVITLLSSHGSLVQKTKLRIACFSRIGSLAEVKYIHVYKIKEDELRK